MSQQQQQPTPYTWAQLADHALYDLHNAKSAADPSWALDRLNYGPPEFHNFLIPYVTWTITPEESSVVAQMHREAQANHWRQSQRNRGRKPYLPEFLTQWRGTEWVFTGHYGLTTGYRHFGRGNAATTLGYSVNDAKKRLLSDLKHEVYPAAKQTNFMQLFLNAAKSYVEPAFEGLTSQVEIVKNNLLAVERMPVRTMEHIERECARLVVDGVDVGLAMLNAIIQEAIKENQ